MSVESQNEIRKIVNEVLREGEQKNVMALGKVAEKVAQIFNAGADEVAILTQASDPRYLRFLIPLKLQQIGRIPLSSTTSLAARTAREKKPELENRFSVMPHASVFEAVPLERERGDPIQKIMSIPLMHNGKLVGVMQVSRKAKTLAQAGPDFTQPQLKELIAIGELVASCIQLYSKV